MNDKRTKLPLKLIIGIVGVFIVFAFSMALTTKTSAQTATDTPTPTETLTATPAPSDTPAASATPAAAQPASPSATPAAGGATSPSATPSTGTSATSTPAPSGSTGSIPVTGQNAAPNLAFSKAVARLSNVSDKSLESQYNEALVRLRRQQRRLNNANNKLNQFANRFGTTVMNNNNNQNGLNASQHRNSHMEEIRDDLAFFMRNVAIAQRQVLFAQNALNGHAGFDADGNLINRQAAINTVALAQTSLVKGGASLKVINGMTDGSGSGSNNRFDRLEERLEQSR